MVRSTLCAIAIETTSRQGEAALVEAGRVVAQGTFAAGVRHAAGLLPLIDGLCRGRGWSPRKIDEIYVSIGPGGFTGTRIGVTFAKTFAFATGARIVPVPTSRVLVENAPAEARHALIVVDARRGKVWTERFTRTDGPWQTAGEGQLTTLAEALARAPRPVWLVGEGTAYHADAIDPRDALIHVCSDAQPKASVVATLGWAMARGEQFADPFALVPTYVRRPEAEEKRLGIE